MSLSLKVAVKNMKLQNKNVREPPREGGRKTTKNKNLPAPKVPIFFFAHASIGLVREVYFIALESCGFSPFWKVVILKIR